MSRHRPFASGPGARRDPTPARCQAGETEREVLFDPGPGGTPPTPPSIGHRTGPFEVAVPEPGREASPR